MKHYNTNRKLLKGWLNRQSPSGRNSTSKLVFKGDTLFSFGRAFSHIHRDKNLILSIKFGDWRTNQYHYGIIRSVTIKSKRKIIKVRIPNPLGPRDHRENIKWMLDESSIFHRQTDNIFVYMNVFDLKRKDMFSELMWETYFEIMKNSEETDGLLVVL